MAPGLNRGFFAPTSPRVFGHRGSAGTHPENTLESFRAAVDAGAQYIELDVRASRDGEVVVSHDDGLERTCGRADAISANRWADLMKFDAGAGFEAGDGSHPYRGRGIRLARFCEVLQALPSTRIIVEIKPDSPGMAAQTLAVIDRAGARERVLVASEHQTPLSEIRALAPEIPTNLSYLECAELLQATAARRTDYKPPGAAMQVPREYEGWSLVSPEIVAYAHRHALEVHIWTVNETREMEELLEAGVDGLISDFPARALAVVAARGARK